jgi:hypothetical protein
VESTSALCHLVCHLQSPLSILHLPTNPHLKWKQSIIPLTNCICTVHVTLINKSLFLKHFFYTKARGIVLLFYFFFCKCSIWHVLLSPIPKRFSRVKVISQKYNRLWGNFVPPFAYAQLQCLFLEKEKQSLGPILGRCTWMSSGRR